MCAAGSPEPQPAVDVRLADAVALVQASRRRSLLLAAASVSAGAGAWTYQKLNPLDPIKLLRLMEDESPDLATALRSGRPSCVAFYAPWCESCKREAADMLRLKRAYSDRLNFVLLNGDDPANAAAVRIFGVDGIPHIALVSSDRQVQRALVGAVPRQILEAALDNLLAPPPRR